jgi:hypothetical protein
MMNIRAVVLALALAACGQSGQQPPAPAPAVQGVDPSALQIDIGRYGVMLGHVRTLTQERAGAAEIDNQAPRELARALRETVWEYNGDRSRLCAKGIFADVACGPAYEPVWISEPSDAEPSLDELQARANTLGEQVMGFWDAVCADARARVEDEQERMYVCAIE